jgi:hypothetical protein
MTVAIDDGTQDLAAAYDGEGQEWAANNDSIRHQTEMMMLFLEGVIHFFFVSTICCFWRVSYVLFCVGFLLTKEKVVHMTLSTTYVEKKRPKTPSTSCFLGRMF